MVKNICFGKPSRLQSQGCELDLLDFYCYFFDNLKFFLFQRTDAFPMRRLKRFEEKRSQILTNSIGLYPAICTLNTQIILLYSIQTF